MITLYHHPKSRSTRFRIRTALLDSNRLTGITADGITLESYITSRFYT